MAATYGVNDARYARVSRVQPTCPHGRATLNHSSTLENPGRRYWRCPAAQPEVQNNGGCAEFVWYDHPAEGEVLEALFYLASKFHIAEQLRIDAEEDNKHLVKQVHNMTREVEDGRRTYREDKVRLEDSLAVATTELKIKIKQATDERLRLQKVVGEFDTMTAKVAAAQGDKESMEGALKNAERCIEEKDREIVAMASNTVCARRCMFTWMAVAWLLLLALLMVKVAE